jgi:2-oxoglutarate ferredoxin oxidoreductase subunit alpha
MTEEVNTFIQKHKQVFVIDQNRDGQMFQLVQLENPEYAMKLHSVKHYDGTPITAEDICLPIAALVKKGGLK